MIEIIGLDIKNHFERLRTYTGDIHVVLTSQKLNLTADGVTEEIAEALNNNIRVLSALETMERAEYEKEIERLKSQNDALIVERDSYSERFQKIREALGIYEEEDEDYEED